MKCSVKNCNSSSQSDENEHSFFSLPKNEQLAKKWLQFCDNPKLKNSRCAFVCSVHFLTVDIVGGMAFEMGLYSKKRLKPGSVPCIKKEPESEATTTRLKRIQERNNKRLVNDPLAEPTVSEEPAVKTEYDEDTKEGILLPPTPQIKKDPDMVDMESSESVIDELHNEIEALRLKNMRATVNLQLVEKKYKAEIKSLKQKLQDAQEKILVLEKQIADTK